MASSINRTRPDQHQPNLDTPPAERNGSSRGCRIITPGRAGERHGSSHGLVSGCGSALARRGRCAEGGTPDPCPGDHPARPGVKVERPQAASSSRTVPAGRRRRPRTNELDAGVCRAGWSSRRVRASAERGRVRGPGRAEADLGPRALPAALSRLRESGVITGPRRRLSVLKAMALSATHGSVRRRIRDPIPQEQAVPTSGLSNSGELDQETRIRQLVERCQVQSALHGSSPWEPRRRSTTWPAPTRRTIPRRTNRALDPGP
jgi:hypothetical protein